MNQLAWNNLVRDYGPRSGAFLQSWQWGEFQEAVGRRVLRVVTADQTSVAQLIEYPIRAGFYGFDLPRGPVGAPDHAASCLSNAVLEAQKTAALFVHVEPLFTPDPTGSRDPGGSRPVEKIAASSRQPEETLLLDLTKTEDELLAAMHEKTRYNVRLAERKGVIVTIEHDPNVFWQLLAQTTKRDEFSPHARSYYDILLRTLSSDSIPHLNPPPTPQGEENGCEAKLFVARYENRPLAAAITISFGKTSTYLHGASSNADRNLMAPQLLQWCAIQDAKRRGHTWYDFWGIDESRWPGVTRFKLGFGGVRESYPPAYDLPLRRFGYRMYRIARILKP